MEFHGTLGEGSGGRDRVHDAMQVSCSGSLTRCTQHKTGLWVGFHQSFFFDLYWFKA